MAAVVWAFMGWREAIAFVLGVCTSMTAGYLGMSISVRTNVQTADLAEESFPNSFRMAVFGGGVMGLLVTGFSLLVLTILFVIFGDPNVLVGFGGRFTGRFVRPNRRRHLHQVRRRRCRLSR
jgi:K(+)-stimulated pyrophosphate-energized sodium pump